MNEVNHRARTLVLMPLRPRPLRPQRLKGSLHELA